MDHGVCTGKVFTPDTHSIVQSNRDPILRRCIESFSLVHEKVSTWKIQI